MIATAIARHGASLVTASTYNPDTTGGNVFVDHMPDQPDVCVSVVAYGGPPVDGQAKHNWSAQSVQITARGAAEDRRGPHDVAFAWFSALAGLTSTTLAPGTVDEVFAHIIDPIQSHPFHLPGTDRNDRHSYVFNVTVDALVPTSHRV